MTDSNAIINIIFTFVVAITTVLLVNRLDAQAKFRQALTDSNLAESKIDEASIGTALQLLDRVKKENMELIARAISLEQVALELQKEVTRLKEDLKESDEAARVLYYQVKALGEIPKRVPKAVTGPLGKVNTK